MKDKKEEKIEKVEEIEVEKAKERDIKVLTFHEVLAGVTSNDVMGPDVDRIKETYRKIYKENKVITKHERKGQEYFICEV